MAASAAASSSTEHKDSRSAVTAAALFQMLKPNYAWAIQIQPDDKRIKAKWATVPSPQRNGSIKGNLVRPTNAAKLPSVLVVHDNRGLNPYIEDVARRLAVADFIEIAPDALTSLGGYPGDDEQGRALFSKLDDGRFPCGGKLAESASRQHGQARHYRLLLRRGRCQSAGGPDGLGSGGRSAVLRSATERRRCRKDQGADQCACGELDKRITDGWPAFDVALTEAHVPREGHIYQGANHGFHNDTTPRYDEAAAKEAWRSTLDWFNKYLR